MKKIIFFIISFVNKFIQLYSCINLIYYVKVKLNNWVMKIIINKLMIRNLWIGITTVLMNTNVSLCERGDDHHHYHRYHITHFTLIKLHHFLLPASSFNNIIIIVAVQLSLSYICMCIPSSYYHY